MLTHVTVHTMQCQKGTQKGEDEFTVNFGFAKSQKPSPASDRIELDHVTVESKISKEGLITPRSKFGGQQTQRLEKIAD